MPGIIIYRKEAKTKYFIEDLGNNVQLEMIAIPSGSFWMGTEAAEAERLIKEYDHEWFRNETPQFEVNISSFFMGRYPITQAQWREVAELEPVERKLDPDPSEFKDDYEGIDRWQRPVERVSWDDAVEFCNRLSLKTKREYRLPTEAEWEYACRAGTETPFHFGETISTELANYDGSIYGEGVKGEERDQTTPVGYFKVANNFGLSDMHGLVWEWCKDDWHDNYENAPNNGSAWLSKASSIKVKRGGSWSFNPDYCRSAYRHYNYRENRYGDVGFRVFSVAPKTTYLSFSARFFAPIRR